jgi:hypothetical protein
MDVVAFHMKTSDNFECKGPLHDVFLYEVVLKVEAYIISILFNRQPCNPVEPGAESCTGNNNS